MKIAEMMRQEEWELGVSLGLVSSSLALAGDAPTRNPAASTVRAPARDVAALLRSADPLPPLVVEDFVFPV